MPEFVDPYKDPATGILRNLVGARTQSELDEFETAATFRRLIELGERPVKFTGDLRQIKEIHRRIFQDVYDWAGKTRVVDLELPGSRSFVPQALLERAAGNVFEELSDENMLKGMDAEGFADRIAYHYDRLNHLHPFREGNGRTQREFWRQVGERAGHPIDFTSVLGSVNDEASRLAGDSFDLSGLRSMFTRVLGTPADRSSKPRKSAGTSEGGRWVEKSQSDPEIELRADVPDEETK